MSRLTPAQLEKYHRHVAVHEAGHAVVGLKLGLDVVAIVLELTDKGGDAYTIFSDGSTSNPVELMRHHPDLMGPTLMAGTSAEHALLEGQLVPGGWKGDSDIFAEGYSGPIADISPAVASARRRAEELVGEHCNAILAVADRLMTSDHLLGVVVAELVNESTTRVRE